MSIVYYGGRTPGKSGDVTKRIQVSAISPRFLEWSNGDALQIVGAGDPEGFLYRSDQSTLIQKLADNGGNCIYMHMVRSNGGDGGADENPFISNSAANGVDQAVLNQWDTWFGEMEVAGIIALLFFYDDGSSPYGDGGSSTLGADEQAFIDACIATFGHRGNIVWLHAEEFSEAWSATRASNFCSYLRSNDVYPRPIGIHQTPGLTATLEDDANVDVFAIQNRSVSASPITPATLHSDLTTAFTNLEAKQHLGGWELQPGHGDGTDEEVRQWNWSALMAGASVAVFRMFIDTTPVLQLQQMRYAQRFFEASDFRTMLPDDSRITGQSLYAMANGADSFIVYGTTATANLGVTGLDAVDYELTWLDVAAGTEVTETVTASAGNNTFTKPGGISGDEVALNGVKA